MHFFERRWGKRWYLGPLKKKSTTFEKKEHHVSQRSALKLKTTNKRK